VTARDIEGENPLYLSQAKVYDACCALGPAITLAPAMPPLAEIEILLEIDRLGQKIWEGITAVQRMVRGFRELIDWLGRDNHFPGGVILLTGAGVVPPDDFSLREGDSVRISVSGIGTLCNSVIQSGS
jgi:2-dehydro-3-deoxy-D-arabinonate dehydratase